MGAIIEPAGILQDLAQWRPSCEMSDDCGNPADHGLIQHGGCSVKLTCSPCYRRFMLDLADWLMTRPESHIVACHECRGPLENPWATLHLEPL